MEDLSRSIALDNKDLVSVYNNSVIVTYIGDNITHARVPNKLLSDTIIPGLAAGSEVEIVIFKTHEVMTDNLDLLGTRWLADILNTNSNAWLLELISKSLLMSTWPKEEIWLAVPLERKNNEEYCMPGFEATPKQVPLMNCSTAIIADKFSGLVDSTLTSCSNSLGFLMGQCTLGCAQCSKGLGSSAPSK